MAKWADYCISDVSYDEEHKYIDSVKVYPDDGDKLGKPSTWKRNEVVKSIEDGNSFVTITKNNENKWVKGANVEIIIVNSKKYLRTDRNKKESDNLENLPEF